MNGKKAKRLRRIAEAQTVDLPKVAYRRVRRRKAVRPGTMLVLVNCTRARYLELKKYMSSPNS